MRIISIGDRANGTQLQEVGIGLLAAEASGEVFLEFGKLRSGSLPDARSRAKGFEMLMPFHG